MDKKFSILMILISTLLGLFLFITLYFSITTSNACLQSGYSSFNLAIPSFRGYCIKRVNQTDIVIPLLKIKD